MPHAVRPRQLNLNRTPELDRQLADLADWMAGDLGPPPAAAIVREAVRALHAARAPRPARARVEKKQHPS